MKGLRFNRNGALYWDNLPNMTPPISFGCFVAPAVADPTGAQACLALTIPTATLNNNFLTIGLEGGTTYPNWYSLRIGGSSGSRLIRVWNPAPAVDNYTLIMGLWLGATDVRMHTPDRSPTSTDNNTAVNMGPCVFTRVAVGGLSVSGYWTATTHISDPFVYNRELVRADYDKIAAGMSPEDLYPEDLLFHIPNLGNYTNGKMNNWYGAHPVALAGTDPVMSTVNTPRINFPEFA